MYPDFKELLAILNAHRVKYLVVGAYAVSIHAQPRATKDIDILVKADAENAKALFEALLQFGAPLQGLTSADSSQSMARSFAWGVSRLVLTFSRRYPALSLMRPGRAGLRILLTRPAD